MARPHSTRSSSSSTLSCIDVKDGEGDASSIAASSTPPTSNADSASGPSRGPKLETSDNVTPPRVMRTRKSVGSYNENILSGTAKRRRSSLSSSTKRLVSGETLVDDTEGPDGPDRQLLGESIRVLDLDWKVDESPGHKIRESREKKTPRRKSTRLDLLQKATSAVTGAASALGKRGRDAMDSGKEKLQALGRKASLRTKRTVKEVDEVEEPLNKKRRLADGTEAKPAAPAETSPAQPVQKSKRWLSQGLYVGQDPELDAAPIKSKTKRLSSALSISNLRRRKFLPLPMFAGARSIDLGRNFRLPFDVFSPLPPGQSKPEEWRKTSKNVFVGEAATLWKKAKLQELSTCLCTPESGCDEDCYNRYMFYECDDTNCAIGAEFCQNRSFEHLKQRVKAGGKYNIGVEVVKTLDRGYGVRSNRSFAPNQIIVEYAGEIITQEECERRMRKEYKDNESYYLMSFDQNMIIDATRGSIARFVNHSCEPNCRMVKWTVAGKPRMALFAGDRGIMTGEELTYDYNFDPFSIKNVQTCRCGAPNCRGVLGPRPKDNAKAREIKEALQPLVAGKKRKLQQALGRKGNAKGGKASKKRKTATTKARNGGVQKKAAESGRRLAKAFTVPAKKVKVVKKKTSKVSLASSKTSAKGPKGGAKAIKKVQAAVRAGKVMVNVRRQGSTTKAKKEKAPSHATPKRTSSAKDAASSVRRNVVKTIRGTSGAGRTIRVIDPAEN